MDLARRLHAPLNEVIEEQREHNDEDGEQDDVIEMENEDGEDEDEANDDSEYEPE